LARTWNIWFCKDGQVITDLREKMNFVSPGRVRAQIDARTRADLMFDWLWPRVEAAPYMSDEILSELGMRLHSQLAAVKSAVSFVLEAKRSGNMRNLYSSPRARMHAFRQQNLGLRVVSCEDEVTKSGDNESGDR
jgi:hypothetical protein